jgi:hypothetical protein
MKRFPSGHGARVVFTPVRSATPMPSSQHRVPRSAPVPKEVRPRTDAPPKDRTPSYAEIDLVEANLKDDPRYDDD